MANESFFFSNYELVLSFHCATINDTLTMTVDKNTLGVDYDIELIGYNIYCDDLLTEIIANIDDWDISMRGQAFDEEETLVLSLYRRRIMGPTTYVAVQYYQLFNAETPYLQLYVRNIVGVIPNPGFMLDGYKILIKKNA